MPLDPGPFANIAAALAFGLALFGAQIGALRAIGWGWARLSDEHREKITAVLTFAFGKNVAPVDALALLLFVNLAASAVLFVLGLRPTSILVLVGIGTALPILLFQRAAGQRARELELALPLALQQVANEMGAGATLETALKKTASSAPPPADIEIARLQRRVEIMGIDEAFAEMARRLNSRSFTLTASVVRVGTSSGGRLIEALKNLSRTLIEIERLNKKIRTASENGRRNLYLMSLIGPVVAIGSALVVDHETSVMGDGLGQLLISIAVLGFLSAHVLGHYLTKAKV